MKHHARIALAGLLSAAALTVVACGGTGAGGADGDAKAGGSEAGESAKSTGMGGMEPSQMGRGSGGMASGMLMENGQYSDKRFIDMMVPHHRGAVQMAEVALQNAEHKKVKQLAENIVSSQEAEIEELKDIKREEFGTSRVPMDMSQTGGMMADPQALADEKPFDDAFIEAMIPHHESAIGMAEVAREESDNPRVEELAGEIIQAQEREISQMRSWHDDWYPRG